MNWEAIGAIGQIVSALAFLLAIVQIGHARSDARRAFAQERVDRSIQINMASAANERLLAVRLKANEKLMTAGDRRPPFYIAATEQLELSPADALSLGTDQMVRWTSVAHTVSYLSELSTRERDQFERTSRASINEPFFRFWFEHTKSMLDPDAVRYIDNLLAQRAEGTR